MNSKTRQRKAAAMANDWNKKYSIGQEVMLKRDGGEKVRTVTTYNSYVMCDEAVVSLKIGGVYSLDSVTPIEKEAEDEN